jgi:hypothetical protein
MAAFLSGTLCSNCQAAGLELENEAEAVCRYCGARNTLDGIICPYCELINAAGAETCQDCHRNLYRPCPACATPNWAGAEHCLRCQGPLDAVAALGARYRTDTAGRLRAQQHEAAGIKAMEAAASERRLAELNAIEERRQQYLNDAIRVRDNQQRLWIAALIILGFIVIAGAVIGLAFMSAH